MYVTIIGSKICYGDNFDDLETYIAGALAGNKFSNALVPAKIDTVSLSEAQFVRFKNAGRRHASSSAKQTTGGISRQRPDRTTAKLNKWDVNPYGELVGFEGPWGDGSFTNRDHMTANSSNQLMFQHNTWPGAATTSSGVKREALAIAVSGKHHRTASYTYGGRTAKRDTPDGTTRKEYAANYPTPSFKTETDEMLKWKANHTNQLGVAKNTLRVEMVGGYAYIYRRSVERNLIAPTIDHDKMLMAYLDIAVKNDTGPRS